MSPGNCVFGTYADRTEVESAISGFRDAGFSGSEISVIFADNRPPNRTERENEIVTEYEVKPPQGAVAESVSGVALGGALGWLAGIGASSIPGVGPVITLGPLMSCFAGVGIGGAPGGFAGSLSSLGIPEIEARRYEGELSHGRLLVAIHCKSGEQIRRAREIMQITRARGIVVSGEGSDPEPRMEAA